MRLGGIFNPGFGLGALRWAGQQADQSMERLATGKQINRASDNPSGMVAVSSLKAELAALNGQVESKQRMGYSLAAKEGGLSVVQDLILELEGAVVTAANTGGMGPREREALQLEVNGILDAIDLLSYSATHNGESLLEEYASTKLGNGSLSLRNDDDAPDSSDSVASYRTVSTSLASLREGGMLNLVDGDLEAALQAVQGARSKVTTARATIGNQQRSLESDIANARIQIESLTGMASEIEDTDYASEVSKLVRAQLLQDVATRTVLIGRQSAESVLLLLGRTPDFGR